MKVLTRQLLIFFPVCALVIVPAFGVDPDAAPLQIVYDENGSPLETIGFVLPIESVLSEYGAEAEVENTVLPDFFEAVIDLVDSQFRNGDEIVVGDVNVQSTLDSNGTLLEDSLEMSGVLGSESVVIRFVSRSNGAVGIDLTIFDGQGTPSEYEFSIQLFRRPTSQNYAVAAIGSCKCSDGALNKCSTQNCEDGVTCPGGPNGQSCGKYTRVLVVSD